MISFIKNRPLHASIRDIRKLSLSRYVIVGFIAYLIFMAVNIPANYAWRLTSKYFPLIKVGSLYGTFWKGYAENIIYKQMTTQRITWEFRPIGLLYGQVQFNWKIENSYINGRGEFGITPLLNFHMSDTYFSFPAEVLNRRMIKYFNKLPLNLDGRIKLYIKKLATTHKNIRTAKGTLSCKSIAGFEFAKSCMIGFDLYKKEKIHALFKDKSGPFKIDGQLTIEQDEYEVSANIETKDKSYTKLNNMLNFIAKPDKDGRRFFKHKGHVF
mmetsp:Transcript_6286/g.3531  ORF Transcript_6286/g.3531 Transcript_6286/m.3531 type:complete len:269 (-) Transcript_6286:601-1407(-)